MYCQFTQFRQDRRVNRSDHDQIVRLRAIKYLLRNKANFDILEGFLSELLKTSIYIEQILESESKRIIFQISSIASIYW